LPEEQRAQSILAILDPWRHPQHPGMGQGLACDRFSAAAEAAGFPVPHLGAALIEKYVADLRQLGMIA